MKKIFFICMLLIAAFASNALCAGSCTQSGMWVDRHGTLYKVNISCTGDSSDGSIPDQTLNSSIMADVAGLFLYTVSAYPTSGGTAPNASDVTVNMNGYDVLGGKGVNLIYPGEKRDTFPYSTFMTSYRYISIISAPTISVANQATASANFTIELLFMR